MLRSPAFFAAAAVQDILQPLCHPTPRTIYDAAHVVVLTLTRIIKSVVTGQAPVTLELRNTPGKNINEPKVVHAYITADAIHSYLR